MTEQKAINAYPRVLHRGAHPNIESKHVLDEQQEAEHLAAGWTKKRPAIPEAAPEKPVLSLDERIAELEDRVAELEAKRGPGRPKKGE